MRKGMRLLIYLNFSPLICFPLFPRHVLRARQRLLPLYHKPISHHGDLQGTIPAVRCSALASFSRILASSNFIISMGSSVGLSFTISFATTDTSFLG